MPADNFKKILDLDRLTPESAIRSSDTGQRVPCFDTCQLIKTLMSNMCALSVFLCSQAIKYKIEHCSRYSKTINLIVQLLLVFSVRPFKIDQNQNQNRSIKSRIWEMKGSTHTKTLDEIQVRGIFRIQDIRRNVLPKLIEICMETQKHLLPSFATKARIYSSRNS